ncbi:MAG: FAD-dependent oxidoreductase, partial [Longimicrobiales bacterium]|nr:FAD-dependent oxidoreductase [Longimicrobiales bacterium]
MTSPSDQNPPSSGITRKTFLGAAGAGTVAAVLDRGRGLQAQQVGGAVEERRTDVVVVGAGMGGLTAAVRAQEQGADVILLEKASEPGGTMRESAGGVWTYATYEEIRNDVPYGDPDLQRTLVETLPRAFAFYESIGAPIGEESVNPPMRIRSIAPVAFTNYLVALFRRNGGELLVETPMLRLITNPRDEVIGVRAHGPDGPVDLLANAVVLATGGWAGDAQLVHSNITRMFGALHQRNAGFNGLKPPFTGDGFWSAARIGAAPSDGGFDSFYGHVLPARPATFTHPLANYSIYHGYASVALNLHGVRFADETRGRIAGRTPMHRAGDELITQEVARQPDASAVFVWDQAIHSDYASAESAVLGSLDKFVAYRDAGAPVARADTLDELANRIADWERGIPADRVRETLREYNSAAEAGRADELPVPKQDPESAHPITEPPFYAVLGTAGITGGHGGLLINPRGQVLYRTRQPVPGLYAAGIDIGNIGNYVYVGFLGYGAVFGYISGGNAAAQPAPRGGW